jgi:uncharacterized protein (TIRG00374 family)
VKPLYLFLVALCYAVIVFTNGLFIKYVIEPFKKNISVQEATRVSLLSSIGNFFASSGAGLGFRAVYLKKKHNLRYQDYMATVYGNYLLIFICSSLIALLGLLFVKRKDGPVYLSLTLLFLSLLAVSIVLCFIRVPAGKKKSKHIVHKIFFVLQEMTSGWNRIVKNRRLLMHLSMVIIIQIILSFCVAWLELRALSIRIGWAETMLLSILGSMSIFVSITPANIGVKELIFIFTATTIGLTTPDILSVSIIDRGVLFATLGILWIFFGRNKEYKNV